MHFSVAINPWTLINEYNCLITKLKELSKYSFKIVLVLLSSFVYFPVKHFFLLMNTIFFSFESLSSLYILPIIVSWLGSFIFQTSKRAMWIKISVSRKVYSFELYKVEDIKQVNFKENESERNSIEIHVRVIFVWPWKMVSISVLYLFYQPMDEKIKTWPLRFPAKENPNMEKALFDWPIVLHCDVKAKYQFISRKFSGMKFFTWAFGSIR